MPKAIRIGVSSRPSISAKPATVNQPVRYGDGVSLRVRSVSFAKETSKGPGSFPGRPYALLTLVMTNKSNTALSISDVVVTVLGHNFVPVPPVYAQEAKVQDFSGTLKPGQTASARYAFAVPPASRSMVTVVVDFDGAHTSAVFRGKLS